MTDMGDEPEYPGGLCIYLCQKELDKLGLSVDALPLGTRLPLDIVCTVVGRSQRVDYDGDTVESIDLQITDIGVETDEDEDAKPIASPFERIYGSGE